MKITVRFAALLLCLVMFFGISACGNDDAAGTPAADGNSSIDESAIINRSDISFATNGESTYRIVRPEGCSQEVNNCATELFKYFKSNVGVSPRNVLDSEEQGDNAEIIIGDTNRPETAIAKQLLRQKNGRANSYIIASVNKSIVIYGLSDAATVEAVGYFKTNYVRKETVSGGIDYSFVESGTYSDISIGANTDLIGYVIVQPYNNLSYVTVLEIEKLQKLFLEKFGYEVKVVKDVESAAAEREIVIGNAKRDGVEKIIEGDVVSVKVAGEKVYLNGGSTYSVAAAVTEFINMLENGTAVKLTAESSKTTDYDTVAATIDNTTDYVATFRDAFDGTAVDLTKWNNFNDYTMTNGQNGKLVKRAKEDYSNLSVKDGVFVTQICEDDEAYYGSMLTTQNKMAFKYGYFEISQIMPKGQTFWTAFWTRPAFATSLYWTEIDVNENFGHASLSRGNCFPWLTSKGLQEGLTAQGGDICWENNYMMYYRYKDGVKTEYADGDPTWEGGDLYYSYHTYGCEWNYDTISFYVDGQAMTVMPIDDLNQPIAMGLRNQHSYLIIGCTAGSGQRTVEQINNVTEKEWEETSRFYVDDVVVYQTADQDIQYDYKDRHYGYTTQMYYTD